MQTRLASRTLHFGLLLVPWGTIWESFFAFRALLEPTVATLRPLVGKWCNSKPTRNETLVHFGYHFGTKVDKSQQKPEKIAAGKASSKKIDFRPLPNWPNVAPVQ